MKTPKAKVNLRKLFKGYQFAAMDSDDRWYVFKEKPVLGHKCWYNGTKCKFVGIGIFIFKGDWKNSLSKL